MSARHQGAAILATAFGTANAQSIRFRTQLCLQLQNPRNFSGRRKGLHTSPAQCKNRSHQPTSLLDMPVNNRPNKLRRKKTRQRRILPETSSRAQPNRGNLTRRHMDLRKKLVQSRSRRRPNPPSQQGTAHFNRAHRALQKREDFRPAKRPRTRCEKRHAMTPWTHSGIC